MSIRRGWLRCGSVLWVRTMVETVSGDVVWMEVIISGKRGFKFGGRLLRWRRVTVSSGSRGILVLCDSFYGVG